MSYGDYPDFSRVNKILVVKLRQLGDVLLSGPVFSALRQRFPAAEIDAYVYADAIPLLEGHPGVTRCIGQERARASNGLTRLLQEGRRLQRIRRARYDLVINLTEGDRGAIAALASGAPIRVGFDPKGSGLFGKKRLYTHIAKQCPSLRHTVERNLDALRRIGIFPSQEDRELFLHLPPAALTRMRSIVPPSFLLIHPSSRWKFKCWPEANMRALAAELLSQGLSLVFTSGPDPLEVKMVDTICSGLDVINLAGQTSLQELAALVSLSEQLVCVDSLPFHLASVFKTPVVALFGPTSDVTWGPWRNPSAQVLTQPFPCRPCYQDGCGGSKQSDCLITLPVGRVMDAIVKIGHRDKAEI